MSEACEFNHRLRVTIAAGRGRIGPGWPLRAT